MTTTTLRPGPQYIAHQVQVFVLAAATHSPVGVRGRTQVMACSVHGEYHGSQAGVDYRDRPMDPNACTDCLHEGRPLEGYPDFL